MRVQFGSTEIDVAFRRPNLGLALEILRQERAAAKAIRRMPKPVPWDWARPRLVPLLAGPRIDPEGESLVRTVEGLGIAVTFGIDLGAAIPLVDEAVAHRWECSPEQIRDAAVANLRRWSARLERTVVRTATMSGYRIRLIDRRPGWASSIVLVPDELRRLFGDHDQVLAAPRRDTLLSFPPDIPGRLAGEIVVDFEMGASDPLLLDPFGLEDGVLDWRGNEEDDDDDDSW